MTRWHHLSGHSTGHDYAERFDRMTAQGADVHGEADRCAALVSPPARVLDAGCGTGRVAIELARRGFVCVGVDLDPSMLGVARERQPQLTWIEADLSSLALREPSFDLIVAAGNVIPLLEPGSEPAVVARMAAHLAPDGFIVAGFGLDTAHLPIPEAVVGLDDYDNWCASAGLSLVDRLATWDGRPYDGGGYAVSVHRHFSGGTLPPSDPYGQV